MYIHGIINACIHEYLVLYFNDGLITYNILTRSEN